MKIIKVKRCFEIDDGDIIEGCPYVKFHRDALMACRHVDGPTGYLDNHGSIHPDCPLEDAIKMMEDK